MMPDGGILCCHYLPGGDPGFLVAGYGLQCPMSKLLGITSLFYARTRGQRCVIVDYRGQGGSSGERWSLTVPGMRADILLAAGHYRLENCIGIGASPGDHRRNSSRPAIRCSG